VQRVVLAPDCRSDQDIVINLDLEYALNLVAREKVLASILQLSVKKCDEVISRVEIAGGDLSFTLLTLQPAQ